MHTSDMNILIFGDSIVWGVGDDKGGWAERLKNSETQNTIYPLGIPGDSSQDLLERFESEAQARLDYEDENLILIAIGTNDSYHFVKDQNCNVSLEKYAGNLARLAQKAKEYNSKIAFLGLTPLNDALLNPVPWKPDKFYKLEFVEEYNQELKNFCNQNNLPFIDVMDKFMQKDWRNMLSDGLHPNPEGHQLLFEIVKEFLNKSS